MTATDSAIMALGVERDEAKDRVRILEGSAALLAGQVLDLEARNAELQRDLDEAYLTGAAARVRCRELEAMKAHVQTALADAEADTSSYRAIYHFLIEELRAALKGEP